MKIREDFVSNSSSSSYVLGLDFNKYDFDLFVKRVCDYCDSGNDDKKLRARNEAILRYTLTFNELLFLGEFAKGRKKIIYKRGFDYNGKPLPKVATYDPFEECKSDYIDKRPEDDPYYARYGRPSAKMLDDDTIEYEEDLLYSGITCPEGYMERHFSGIWNARSAAEKRKEKVKNICNMCVPEGDDNLIIEWDSPFHANTYKITKNTINNTRDMLKEGCKIDFDDWQDLDALEARINAGETLFFMEVGDAGEGYDDSRIYSLAGQYPFDGIPVSTI